MSTLNFSHSLPKRKHKVFAFVLLNLALSFCLAGASFSGVNKMDVAFQKKPPVIISLKVVQNVMQYDKKLFTVKAGQKVTINFENPDFMQHNLVIIKPGATEKVGAAVDLMASDPKGSENNYIPKLKEVLFSTKLLLPQEKISLQFTAPAQPGDYPFICTFPGHWRIMNGIMKVVK